MPESPGLYLRLSVTENLACFTDLYEVPDPDDRIDRALRAVSLADRARDACGTLSKGLRQRVAWPGLCSATRKCCSSTSQPPAWTRSPAAHWCDGHSGVVRPGDCRSTLTEANAHRLIAASQMIRRSQPGSPRPGSWDSCPVKGAYAYQPPLVPRLAR
jgi:hypothetical protein